jgi:dienelactone hydrolase
MSKIAKRVAMRVAAAATLVAALFTLPYAAEAADDLRAALRLERERAPAPRLPRSAFVLHEPVSAVVLSADGRQVAWLHEAGRNREVWMRATDGGAPRRLLPHTAAQRLHWSRDGRWLLLESPRQVFALAVAGQIGSGIVTTLGGADRRVLMDVDDTRPAAVIVLEAHGRKTDGTPAAWSLWRIDHRGRRTRLHHDTQRIIGHALDPQGRLAYIQRVEGLALSVRRMDADGRHREVARCTQLRRCTPLTTTTDGRGLWLRGNVGDAGERELVRLIRIDDDGSLRTVHIDPRGEADLDALAFDPSTRQPIIASHRSTVAANHGLDADSRRHVQRLEALFPQRDLRIAPGSGSGARWLIEVRAGHQQGSRWHLYDPAKGTAARLFDVRPLDARSRRPADYIAASALTGKLPVRWRASDGMLLHGFVYLPPGRDASTLPLVVAVHGGPWNHWGPDYNGISQFLANRGYAVFEPNFRGSTGHGRAYQFAANGDFGNGRVQQDIVDGTRHLLTSGIGDAQRVGIVGASFGGYSTLLGVTFQPELFKVGVAFVPPPDFAWTLRWILRNPESLALDGVVPMADMMRMLALDTRDPALMARLHAQSPLANAARMDRPLLLVAGGEDRRVGIAGVIEYAARLKLAGKDVSLLVDADAGHANREPLVRESNLYLLEAMLHRHLGGAAPQAPDAALQQYLSANLRLCGRAPDRIVGCPRAGAPVTSTRGR